LNFDFTKSKRNIEKIGYVDVDDEEEELAPVEKKKKRDAKEVEDNLELIYELTKKKAVYFFLMVQKTYPTSRLSKNPIELKRLKKSKERSSEKISMRKSSDLKSFKNNNKWKLKMNLIKSERTEMSLMMLMRMTKMNLTLKKKSMALKNKIWVLLLKVK